LLGSFIGVYGAAFLAATLVLASTILGALVRFTAVFAAPIALHYLTMARRMRALIRHVLVSCESYLL
jgi:hypothetical protein